MTRNSSRRNITIVIILVAVFAASMLLLNNNKTMTVDNQNISPSEIVADIERNLIALEMKQITLEEFKTKTSANFHKYYVESYFSGKENASAPITFAANTTSPQDIQISKAYINANGDRQTVFVKIPIPDFPTSLVLKSYVFAKEGDSWKVLQTTQNLVSTKDEGSRRYREKFNTINGVPIEYHNLEMK